MTVYYMGKPKPDEDYTRPTKKRASRKKTDGSGKGRPQSTMMQELYYKAKELNVGECFMADVDPGSSVCSRLTGMLPNMRFTQKKQGDLLRITRTQ